MQEQELFQFLMIYQNDKQIFYLKELMVYYYLVVQHI